ncbi:MAG TPA: PKD domain-containing protein [Solirubrobacteraceae bacterium]|nr:PKD domain-containing protein [Solirubrobacteraceae bacterium]
MTILTSSLIAVPAAAAGQPAPPGRIRYAQIRPVCPPPTPGHATCTALARIPVAASIAAQVGALPYTQNDGASESGPTGGLTPTQLARAYEYDPASGGTGQTVAIVVAYDDPKIEEDLATFDEHYELPPCTTENGCLKKVGQEGPELPKADESGWSGEASLDVETVHSVCSNCKILLVEAKNYGVKNLAASASEAVELGATEVSNSYASPEVKGEGGFVEAGYNHPGVVITAGAGDYGYDNWDYVPEGLEAPEKPSMPASLPTVVAVGGTSLELNANGTRESESVWNDNGPPSRKDVELPAATGGGCSTLFTAPLWQQEAPGWANTGCKTMRLVADISAVADPLTGFAVYDSYNCGAICEKSGLGKGWVTLGGTSLSTPFVTGLYALAGGSGGVPYPALTLYGHIGQELSLYDVTQGGNGYCDDEAAAACGEPKANEEHGKIDCEGTTACDAAPGFDGPSGVGAPHGLGAFRPLLPAAVITPPASLRAGSAASFNASASTDPYPGGSISSYSWNWGDGSVEGTGVAPTHTFVTPGTYTVTLTITDNYGLVSAPVTQAVTVPAPPALTTDQASSPTQTTATLNATVNPEGATVTECEFEYGPTNSYGKTASCASLPGSGTSPVELSAEVTGLTANTTYHFRISATNAGGTSKGSDQEFKTLPNAPTVETKPASPIAQTTTTLNASVNPNGATVTECEFEYGTTNSYGKTASCASLPGSGTSPVEVSAEVTGLTANTTYHFRISATNAGGTTYGSEQTLSTLPNPPAIGAAEYLPAEPLPLRGAVDPNGGEVTACYFEYGITPLYGTTTPCVTLPGAGTAEVQVDGIPEGLIPNATYYLRVVATNAGGTSYGGDLVFKAVSDLPSVLADSSSRIEALIAGRLVPVGKKATIDSLLRTGAFIVEFSAVEAGELAVDWYEVPRGARLAKGRPKPVLVATGKRSFSEAGSARLKLRLTVAGRLLLRNAKQLNAKQLKLTAEGTFTPTGMGAVSAFRTFVLKR